MTSLRDAAQQALEALENIDKEFRKHGRKHWPEAVKAHSAIAPLRAALAEPVQGCPSCEYNKARAQLWRHEAYKAGGYPLDWEPELMVRPKPLTEEEIKECERQAMVNGALPFEQRLFFARAIERAHGIGEKE